MATSGYNFSDLLYTAATESWLHSKGLILLDGFDMKADFAPSLENLFKHSKTQLNIQQSNLWLQRDQDFSPSFRFRHM